MIFAAILLIVPAAFAFDKEYAGYYHWHNLQMDESAEQNTWTFYGWLDSSRHPEFLLAVFYHRSLR